MRTISKILEQNDGQVPSFAWPGGYEVYFVMKDGEVMCHECVELNLDQIKQAESEGNWDNEWAVVDARNLSDNESELVCSHCQRVIDHGWYSIERVQDELPDVRVRFNNVELKGRIKGRQLDFPTVYVMIGQTEVGRQYSWEAIQDALNDDRSLIMEQL